MYTWVRFWCASPTFWRMTGLLYAWYHLDLVAILLLKISHIVKNDLVTLHLMGQLVKEMDVIEAQLYWCDATKLSFFFYFPPFTAWIRFTQTPISLLYSAIGALGVGRPPKKVKKDFCKINSTRVSAGLDGSKVDRNGRRSGRHPPPGFRWNDAILLL